MATDSGVERKSTSDGPIAPSTWALLAARPRSAVLVVAVALAYLAQALAWGARLPRFDAPDEPEHFEMSAFIADHGRFPVQGRDVHAHLLDETTHEILPAPPVDPSTGFTRWTPPAGHKFSVREHYAGLPGAGYFVSAAAIRVARAFGADDDLESARAGSALCGAATVLLLGLVAVRLRPDRPELHFLVPSCAAFLPQFVFAGAYVNGDAYAAAASVAVSWRLLVGMQSGWRIRDAAWFGAALGAAFLGKSTAWWPAASAAVGMFSALRRGVAPLLLRGAVAVTVAALAASPWIAFSMREYGSPIGGDAAPSEVSALRASLPPDVARDVRLAAGGSTGADMHATYASMLRGRWGHSLVMSFVGKFGWMTKPLLPWHYDVIWGIGALGLVGACWAAARRLRTRSPPADAAFVAIVALAAPVQLVAALWFSMHRDFQPQGRYLFSALTGIALCVAFGWTSAVRSTRGRTVVAWFVVAATAVVCGLAFEVACA